MGIKKTKQAGTMQYFSHCYSFHVKTLYPIWHMSRPIMPQVVWLTSGSREEWRQVLQSNIL